MPFFEEAFTDTGPREPQLVKPPTDPKAGLSAIWGAAARTGNTVVSTYNYLNERTGFTYDPNHNPIDLIGGTKYEANHLERFVNSYSEADTRARMSRIDREEKDRELLDKSGWNGVVARIGMGLLDPTLFLPAGQIYRGVKSGRAALDSAKSVGAATGAAAAVQESILYGTQETHSGLEATAGVATATILGGLLGASISKLTSREIAQLTDVVDGFRGEINAGLKASSAGAAEATREPLTLAPAANLETGLARLSPVTRLQNAEFDTARAAVRDLADAGLSYRENRLGTPTSEGGTVETRIKMRRGPMIDAIQLMDDAYARYFFDKTDVSVFERRTAALRGDWSRTSSEDGGKLSAREFRHEIGKAMSREDQHAIPQVAEAAKAYRDKVFTPLRDEAVKLGLLPKDTEKVVGAPSYLTRVYNRTRINAERDQWLNILTGHITEERDTAISKFTAKQEGRVARFQEELTDIELPVAARPGAIAKLETDLQSLRANQSAFAAIDDQLEHLRTLRGEADDAGKAAINEQMKALRTDAPPEYHAYVSQRNALQARIDRVKKLGTTEVKGASSDALEAFNRTRAEELKTIRAVLDDELELLAHARDKELEQGRSIFNQQVAGTRGAKRAELKAKLKQLEASVSLAHDRAVRKAERQFAPMLREFEKAKRAERKTLEKSLDTNQKAADRATRLREMIDRAKVARNPNELGEMADAEIRSLAEEITNTILGESAFRLPGIALVQGPKGPMRKRILKIPDELIEDFLERDIEKVARIYTSSMSGDIELAAKFGDVKLEGTLNRLRDEYNVKINSATSAQERDRLKKAYERSRADLEGLRDRVRGNYAMPSDPDGLMYRAGRVALNLNYLARLGGVTISALPDLARPIMRYGLDAFRDGWAPLVTNLSAVKMSAREVRLAGTALDMVRDQRAMELADLLDDFGRNSKFERGVQYLADRYSMVNLMSPWNGALKSLTGVITLANVMRATEAVAKGKATKKQIDQLAQGGVDDAMARRIWAEAEKSGNDANGVFLPNTEAWTDLKAVEAMRAVINREVETLIITPGLEKPLWMSTSWGRIIGQFKSFAMVSTQRTLIAGLQQRDAAALSGALVAMGLGAMTAQIKALGRGEDTGKWNEARWVAEALDNSGLLGILMEANAMSEKITGGRLGLSVLTGKEISRYQSRNAIGAALGPTADFASDALTLGRLGGEKWSRSDTKAIRKIIPFQNLFYLRGLFDKIEEGVNDQFNIPAQRPR